MYELAILLYYLTTMVLDLHILHSGHDPHCTARVDKHFEGYCSLQLITRGRVELFYDQQRFDLGPGSWWVCYPGPHIRFHARRQDVGWEHRWIAFYGPQLDRWRSDGLVFLKPQVSGLPELIERFDQTLSLAAQPDELSQRRAVNLLEGILLELTAHRRTDRATSPVVQSTIDQLCADSAAACNYGQLAARLGVSLTTLRRTFRRDTGISLHAYALKLRLAEARRLLGETDASIKTICRQLGYKDIYFFSRQFRQFVGMPPATYRRSRRQ